MNHEILTNELDEVTKSLIEKVEKMSTEIDKKDKELSSKDEEGVQSTIRAKVTLRKLGFHKLQYMHLWKPFYCPFLKQ